MKSTEKLIKKFYSPAEHPYRIYELEIELLLNEDCVILDAGCGRTAPVLKKFLGKAKTLIGVDLEKKDQIPDEIRYIQCSIDEIDMPENTVDVVISRAVLEHIKNPLAAFKEINRVLKPNGDFIFLVPNLGDYVSFISFIIPNKYHRFIVSKMEGRDIEDVFPAYYKVNTHAAIKKNCKKTEMEIKEIRYLSQYPSIFMFNSYFFLLGVFIEKIISKWELFKYFRGWLLVHLKKI